MNAKKAKQVRKFVKQTLGVDKLYANYADRAYNHIDRLGRVIFRTLHPHRRHDENVLVVLPIKMAEGCPRAIYQRAKRKFA